MDGWMEVAGDQWYGREMWVINGQELCMGGWREEMVCN